MNRLVFSLLLFPRHRRRYLTSLHDSTGRMAHSIRARFVMARSHVLTRRLLRHRHLHLRPHLHLLNAQPTSVSTSSAPPAQILTSALNVQLTPLWSSHPIIPRLQKWRSIS